jgi:hypothetical protein
MGRSKNGVADWLRMAAMIQRAQLMKSAFR